MRTLIVNTYLDPYDVYIGRGGLGIFGNPFTLVKYSRQDSLVLFKDYFLKRVQEDEQFKQAVENLRGKRLGCFCAYKGGITADDALICHGQIIATYLEGNLT